MSLTDVGTEFYSHCLAMIAEAEAAEEVAARLHGQPRGIVRASCPPGLVQTILAKRLPQFLSEFPDVRVQLHVSNRRMDLIEHRLDVAIRARSRLDTDGNLIVRQLAESRLKLVASPSFVTTYGMPASVEDLKHLPTLTMEEHSHEHVWQLIGPDMNESTILHEPRLASSDFTSLLESAIRGIGIGLLPDLICDDAIRNGKLVHVLPDWHPHVSIIHLLFASRRGLLPAVRVFIDFLVQVFAEEPHELIEQHPAPV